MMINNHGKQEPPQDSGIDTFEFWCPERRPGGQNIAMNINPAITDFGVSNILNGFIRPTIKPNAWIAAQEDQNPSLNI